MRKRAGSPAASAAEARRQRSIQLRRHRPDRAEPLAPTLAADPDQVLLGVEVVEVQPDELADAQAAAVEGLEHRPVADAERRRRSAIASSSRITSSTRSSRGSRCGCFGFRSPPAGSAAITPCRRW